MPVRNTAKNASRTAFSKPRPSKSSSTSNCILSVAAIGFKLGDRIIWHKASPPILTLSRWRYVKRWFSSTESIGASIPLRNRMMSDIWKTISMPTLRKSIWLNSGAYLIMATLRSGMRCFGGCPLPTSPSLKTRSMPIRISMWRISLTTCSLRPSRPTSTGRETM